LTTLLEKVNDRDTSKERTQNTFNNKKVSRERRDLNGIRMKPPLIHPF
jgi:hypothetical protein